MINSCSCREGSREWEAKHQKKKELEAEMKREKRRLQGKRSSRLAPLQRENGASPGRMTHLGISFNKRPSSQTGEEETWTQLTSAAPETSKPPCSSSQSLTSIKRLIQSLTFLGTYEILIYFFISIKIQSHRKYWKVLKNTLKRNSIKIFSRSFSKVQQCFVFLILRLYLHCPISNTWNKNVIW